MRWWLLSAALWAGPLLAQEEPTPFWLPPPASAPAKKKPAPPARKPAREKSVEEAPPPARKRREPAPPPAKKQRVEEEAPPRVPKRRRVDVEPQRKRAPLEPAPRELPAESEDTPRRPVTPVAPEPGQPRPAPAPPRPAPAPPKPAPADAPAAVVAELPAAEPPAPEEPRGPNPRFSAGLDLGAWGKPAIDGTGRHYDFAYGVRFGYELLPERLELELQALRAGRTAGSAFANASTTHDLFALRALYLLPLGWSVTALAGGGAGVSLAQAHYAVQDVGATPQTLDSTSARLVLQVTAGVRARVYRGLELRGEVSGLLRDGRLDLLPLAAASWGF